MFLSTFWDVMAASFIIFFVFVPLILLWVYALADLFGRRDIRWRKVLWLLGIIVFPFFGPLIYLIVRPEPEIDYYRGRAVPPRAPAMDASPMDIDEPQYRPS
jgi:hypothetical protein